MLFGIVLSVCIVVIQPHAFRRDTDLQSRVFRRDTKSTSVSNLDKKKSTDSVKYDLICYYTNWAQYRRKEARFFPKNIDPSLCTHIIFSFARIDHRNKIAYYEWNDDVMIKKVVKLKKQKPDLKVLIAVGGWNHETHSSPFSKMAEKKETRKIFIDSVIEFLKEHELDGLDLNWEFPAQRFHGRPQDKQTFTFLCKELKERFGKTFILTAAVSANHKKISLSYEPSKLSKYLDKLHVMTYDLAGGWDLIIGHHTALNEVSSRSFSVKKSIDTWVNAGFPKDKLVLGIATYGRSFKMLNPLKNQIGNQAAGYGKAGQYTNLAGSLAYFEICELISKGMKETFDNFRKVPFGVQGDQWVGYENVQSVIEKAKFIKSQGLKGGMFWSLDFDDFTGKFCNNGTYPLLKAMKNELENSSTLEVKQTTDDKPIDTSTPNDSKEILKTSENPENETKSKTPKDESFPDIMTCKSVPPFNSDSMTIWCIQNCAGGYCPKTHCICE